MTVKLTDFAVELLTEAPELGVVTPRGAPVNINHGTLLSTTIEEWKTVVKCDRVTLWLLDPASQKLYNIASTQLGNSMIALPMGVGLAGQAAKTGGDVFVKDAYDDPGFNRAVDAASGYRSIQGSA